MQYSISWEYSEDITQFKGEGIYGERNVERIKKFFRRMKKQSCRTLGRPGGNGNNH